MEKLEKRGISSRENDVGFLFVKRGLWGIEVKIQLVKNIIRGLWFGKWGLPQMESRDEKQKKMKKNVILTI